jgi:hypothetical protein
VVVGLAAVPLVATFLTQTNPQLVSKVSPVIARIFSPIVLVMLVIYLFAWKSPRAAWVYCSAAFRACLQRM